jgi:HupE / UreJ protein
MTRVVCALALVVIGTAALIAHPLSTFGARIDLGSGPGDSHVTVTLNADAAPMLAALDALAGQAASADAVLTRVTAHTDLIVYRSSVVMDGERVPLTAGPPRFNEDGQIEVVLTGVLPEAGSTLTWQSRWIFGTYPMSVTRGTNTTETVYWIDGQAVSEPIVVRGSATHVATLGRYVQLGFEHILPKGLDHILFVLGLFLLTPRVRSLLAQVTVFTVAHSLSLALAIGGVLSVQAWIVEPLIAVSIAYVGIENLRRDSLSRARLWVVGAFGLLHGLGFAGVLADLALPAGQWLTALTGFNVGVELGQLAVLLGAAGLMAVWRVTTPLTDQALRRPASATIAVMGLYWFVTRLAGS